MATLAFPASELLERARQGQSGHWQQSNKNTLCSWGAAPRGMVTEVAGGRSSGRTAFTWSAIAKATRSGEVCAVVDAESRLDVGSAERAGVDLKRLLWVRCDRSTEAAFRAVDLLLHAGGFAVVALDLCDTLERDLRRVPLSYWFRFRRAVEGTATALLVVASRPTVGTSAGLQVDTSREGVAWRGELPFPLLESVTWQASARKPVWAGHERVMARSL